MELGDTMNLTPGDIQPDVIEYIIVIAITAISVGIVIAALISICQI